MSYFDSKIIQKGQRGFTLIELLVTIGIVVAILAVVVMNQSFYTDSVALNNSADEISLFLSEAQAYGVGVRELTPGSEDFSASYGVAFSEASESASRRVIFFADRDENSRFNGDWTCPDSGSCDEYLNDGEILAGNYISSICLVRHNETTMCNIDRVDVNFVRPSTEANLTFFNNGGNYFDPQPDNVKGVIITLTSPRGTEREVVVYKTGQISVQ